MNTHHRLRTVVVGEHAIFRRSLVVALTHLPEVTVVAEAVDGEEALRYVDELDPDLLVLNLDIPKLNGWEVLERLQSQRARVQVIVLSDEPLDRISEQTQKYNTVIFVFKGEAAELLHVVSNLTRHMGSADSNSSPPSFPN